MVEVVGATIKVTESLPISTKVERAMELTPLLQISVVAGASFGRIEWKEHNPGTGNSHQVSSILAAMLHPQELLHLLAVAVNSLLGATWLKYHLLILVEMTHPLAVAVKSLLGATWLKYHLLILVEMTHPLAVAVKSLVGPTRLK